MTVLVEAARIAWRCGAAGCIARPVLAYYTKVGGGYLRIAGQRWTARYVVDLTESYLDAQCPSCGEWRRLRIERITGEAIEESRPGPWPDVT